MHDLALTDHGQATLGVALETPAKKAAAEGAYAEQVLSAADNGLVTLEVLDKWTKAFQNGYLLWDVYVGELIQVHGPDVVERHHARRDGADVC